MFNYCFIDSSVYSVAVPLGSWLRSASWQSWAMSCWRSPKLTRSSGGESGRVGRVTWGGSRIEVDIQGQMLASHEPLILKDTQGFIFRFDGGAIIWYETMYASVHECKPLLSVWPFASSVLQIFCLVNWVFIYWDGFCQCKTSTLKPARLCKSNWSLTLQYQLTFGSRDSGSDREGVCFKENWCEICRHENQLFATDAFKAKFFEACTPTYKNNRDNFLKGSKIHRETWWHIMKKIWIMIYPDSMFLLQVDG